MDLTRIYGLDFRHKYVTGKTDPLRIILFGCFISNTEFLFLFFFLVIKNLHPRHSFADFCNLLEISCTGVRDESV